MSNYNSMFQYNEKLKGLEQELEQLKARNRFLEFSYHAGQQTKVGINLLEARQDIIDALKDSKTKVQNKLIDANDTIKHLRYGTRQLQEKVDKLQTFIGSRGLKTGVSYDIYKLVDDNQKLNQGLEERRLAVNALIADRQMKYEEYQKVAEELQRAKERIEYLILNNNSNTGAYQGYLTDLKSALAVEVANVCDLDQEKQDLIEILADRNETITCLKADNDRLEKSQLALYSIEYVERVRLGYEKKLDQLQEHLAATVASNTSFTLSGDYQVTKISKGKSLSTWIEDNQEQESNPEDFDTWRGQETDTWDDDIDDEPDLSIGW
jgi:hypothetical protein